MTLISGCGSIAEARPERAELPSFDFKVISEGALWYSVHVMSLTPGPEGLVIQIANEDPQLFGPECEFPANQPLWLHLRLRSEQGGDCQVFYFQDEPPREEESVHFQAPAGQWYEVVVALPPLTGRWRLRLDPPGDHGLCILDRLWLEERLESPAPPKQKTGARGSDALIPRASDRKLAHIQRYQGLQLYQGLGPR